MSPAGTADQGAPPRATVVVIVRDGERFIAEALESILEQSMTDWEAIIVDDGSCDGTRAIVERFVAIDPSRRRLLTHPDGTGRGMSASRNLGIRHARADLVTFLDHDDAMLPMKLARQCELLDHHPTVAAAIGPNIRWHSWDGRGTDHRQDLGVAAGADGIVLDPPSLLPIFLERTNATPQAPMVRRAALESIGGFDESFPGMYEDQVFLAKLLLAERVVVTDEAWHRYRQHDASCVQRTLRDGRQHRARRRFLRWLDRRLQSMTTPPPGLRAMVRRQRWRSLRAWLIGLVRR